MILFSDLALSNASFPHGYLQSTQLKQTGISANANTHGRNTAPTYYVTISRSRFRKEYAVVNNCEKS